MGAAQKYNCTYLTRAKQRIFNSFPETAQMLQPKPLKIYRVQMPGVGYFTKMIKFNPL